MGIKKFKSSKASGWGNTYSLTYHHNKKRLVCFGKVTKDLCSKFGVKADVYMADFNWDLVLDMISDNKAKYTDVS